MKTNDYIETLIAKVLADEATPAEILELESWRAESLDNDQYFDILNTIYSKSPDAQNIRSFDTDAAWLEVKNKIADSENSSNENRFRVIGRNFNFIRIAASLFIIAGLSLAAYKFLSKEKIVPVTLASGNELKDYTLPDSTKIFMNRGSNLEYAFSKSNRKVKLNGEAFFDLAKDNNRPFEVTAGTLIIQDIGTSFNVNAPSGSDSVIVFVESGEVVLTSPSNNSVSLVKGEKVVYLKKRDQFIQELVTDTNALAYKTKIFVFENASLVAVVQKLNEVYGTDIILSENLNGCHLTATFKNEEVGAILDIIAETLGLKVKNENGKIIVEGEGCDE